MKEKWKDIEGYEGLYKISNKGRIKSLDRYCTRTMHGTTFKQKVKGRIKKQSTAGRGRGYKKVQLSKNGASKIFSVHRLVGLHFVDGYSDDKEINHIDSNPSNNKVSNLEWVTHKENMKHSVTNGKIARKLTDKQIKEIRQRLNNGETQQSISEDYDVTRATISHISTGEIWSYI